MIINCKYTKYYNEFKSVKLVAWYIEHVHVHVGLQLSIWFIPVLQVTLVQVYKAKECKGKRGKHFWKLTDESKETKAKDQIAEVIRNITTMQCPLGVQRLVQYNHENCPLARKMKGSVNVFSFCLSISQSNSRFCFQRSVSIITKYW